jgi:hypothetical protein
VTTWPRPPAGGKHGENDAFIGWVPAGVDDAHAVRPDQANPCLTDFGEQAGLERFSGRIGLGQIPP